MSRPLHARSLPPILALAALAAACSDSTDPKPPTVASIVVTGIGDSLDLADSIPLAAEARDARGRAIRGAGLVWSVLDEALATIVGGRLVTRDTGQVRLVVATAPSANVAAPFSDTVATRVVRIGRDVDLAAATDSVDAWGMLVVRATARDRSGQPIAGAPVTWSWSDTSVASIAGDTAIFAKKVGAVTWLRASVGGATDSIRVRTVFNGPAGTERFAGNGPFVAVAAAGFNSNPCAVSAAGALWCNLAQVAGTAPPLRDVRVGQELACGTAADSTFHCVGTNREGNFGNGTRTPFRSDTLYPGGGGAKYLWVETGEHRATCAARAADSVVVCAGHNDTGQLGRLPALSIDSVWRPIPGALKAKQVDISAFVGCAVTFDDALWCWGMHGVAFPVEGTDPVRAPVQVAPAGSFVQVAVSDSGVCALKADGTAWCWGGRLPDYRNPALFAPRQVASPVAFTQLSGGGYEWTCGVGTDGRAYCWRWAAGPAYTALPVMKDRRFSRISVGWTGTCGLTTDGRAFCF